MKFYARKRRIPAVIIVPMVDILAILLIFVIITTTFKQAQPEIVFKLAQSKSAVAGQETSKSNVLTIDPSGKISYDDQVIATDSKNEEQMKKLASFLEDLKLKSPEKQIALKAEEGAPWGTVIKVIDAFKDAGIKEMPAFVEPSESGATK